jgi:hypothetical protein
MRLELHVDDGADDLRDLSDCVGSGHFVLLPDFPSRAFGRALFVKLFGRPALSVSQIKPTLDPTQALIETIHPGIQAGQLNLHLAQMVFDRGHAQLKVADVRLRPILRSADPTKKLQNHVFSFFRHSAAPLRLLRFANFLISVRFRLQRLGAGDDLDQLLGDHRLAGAVIG